ncbi:MAG: methyl-accepting chemotaxis protein [Bacillota bacterium]|nr:methyl-accepting chemotaxis protein [Bacillota bacterium]
MKWLGNLKISLKLSFSFITVALFIAIVGFIGLTNVEKINSKVESIYKLDLIAVKSISQINENFLKVQGNIIHMLYEEDDSEVQKYLSEIASATNKNNELLAEYESTITLEEDRKRFAELNNLLKEYRASRDNLVTLIKDNKSADAIAAFSSFDSLQQSLSRTLNDYVDFNVNLAKADYEESMALHSSSKITVIAAVITGFALALILGLLMSGTISRKIKRVLKFSEALGKGDLTSTIEINSMDEIGVLSAALNNSVINVRNLVQDIINSAETLSASSEELSAAAEEVSSSIEAVNESSLQVSAGAQDLSSATEEVGTLAGDIALASASLAEKAKITSISVTEIKQRVINIKSTATESIQAGNKLYEEKRLNILKSIEEGKVVNDVKIMADSIASIAAQTNLLSLNAAIEAAQAGDRGRGFAIVADEIRKLADQSSKTVSDIQRVVDQVRKAFFNLSKSGQEVLDYIYSNVQPNYELLMDIGIQYDKDAEFIHSVSQDIAVSSRHINENIENVSSVLQNVSGTAEESAASSEEIMSSISEVSMAISGVAESAQSQSELAQMLTSIVQKFRV